MLIEFRAANFRSLNEAQTLSLVAGSAGELIAENTIESGLSGFSEVVAVRSDLRCERGR